MMRHFYLTAGACLLTALMPLSSARGGALSLDGVGDWVELVGTGFPTGDAPFTIGAWINPTSIPAGGANGGQVTFWGTQGPVNNSNGMRLRGEAGVRHYFWGNDHDENLPGSVLADTTGPSGDGWHHLAVTYDGSQTVWYHNGAPLGAPRAVSGVSVADANYRLGSRLDAEYFHGFIDEVSVWNVPLDAATIAGGYTLPIDANNPLVSPFLVAYYNFENGLSDVAGGDNGGTAMGEAFVDGGANAPIVPEPSSAILCLLGLTGLLARRRRSGRC